MPHLVFDAKGVPAPRRERIEAAVVTGGKRMRENYEAWITTDPFHGDVSVLITGLQGFERRVRFAVNEDAHVITERVRATLDE